MRACTRPIASASIDIKATSLDADRVEPAAWCMHASRPRQPPVSHLMTLSLAHRGDWSASPENTLAAFAAAEQAGADMIELDVQLTADGAVVVLHDDTLDRVWGVARAVVDLTLEEVREAAHGEHRTPTLAVVLDAVALPIMLDYKEETGVVEPALAEVRRAGAVERTVWAGHNLEGHALLRRLEPGAR